MNFTNYSIIRELGRGGMAKVYLAEHKTLEHKVAIKVLNKEYFHNDNIRKRFLAEARSLAQMNHPNIVRVTDLIEENENKKREHEARQAQKRLEEEKARLRIEQQQQIIKQEENAGLLKVFFPAMNLSFHKVSI